MTFTGRDGQLCACAAVQHSAAATFRAATILHQCRN